MTKMRLWIRSKYVDTYNNFRSNCFWRRSYNYLPRIDALSFFSRIPIVSFYPNTLRAIGYLKSLPDKENTLNGILYTSTLKKGIAIFDSISKIIQKVYDVQSFDEIKFKRTEQHLTELDQISNKTIFNGGDCFIELRYEDKLQATLYEIDEEFSDIRREIDRIARKRLAVAVFIFGIAAVITGVLI